MTMRFEDGVTLQEHDCKLFFSVPSANPQPQHQNFGSFRSHYFANIPEQPIFPINLEIPLPASSAASSPPSDDDDRGSSNNRISDPLPSGEHQTRKVDPPNDPAPWLQNDAAMWTTEIAIGWFVRRGQYRHYSMIDRVCQGCSIAGAERTNMEDQNCC